MTEDTESAGAAALGVPPVSLTDGLGRRSGHRPSGEPDLSEHRLGGGGRRRPGLYITGVEACHPLMSARTPWRSAPDDRSLLASHGGSLQNQQLIEGTFCCLNRLYVRPRRSRARSSRRWHYRWPVLVPRWRTRWGRTLPAAVTSGSLSVARRCPRHLHRPHCRRPRLQRPEGPVSAWIRLWAQPTVDSRPASALVSRHCPRRRRCRRLRGRPGQTWASASDT